MEYVNVDLFGVNVDVKIHRDVRPLALDMSKGFDDTIFDYLY
jgi:hypothetical protein